MMATAEWTSAKRDRLLRAKAHGADEFMLWILQQVEDGCMQVVEGADSGTVYTRPGPRGGFAAWREALDVDAWSAQRLTLTGVARWSAPTAHTRLGRCYALELVDVGEGGGEA